MFLFFAFLVGWIGYRLFFGPAVKVEGEEVAFYIRTGATAEEVKRNLLEGEFVDREGVLEWLMKKKNYSGDLVVPGKYILRDGMSLNELMDHLRAGNGEEQVPVIFNTARTLAELAGKVGSYIEADSLELINRFTDPEVERKYGFNRETFKAMFLPDTYLFEWDTDADEFIERMADEYKSFWTAERKRRAEAIGLSQSEVTTLASVVQAEQQIHPQERPVIAGLYLNRLRRGMRLQSDPTVIYALGDFSITRVLNAHLSADHPYNTYVYTGLPPGPINIPSKQSIDAVLNSDDNDYLYMCAKPDFSGYHAFAKSLSEHNRNAAAFRRALNDRKIYR